MILRFETAWSLGGVSVKVVIVTQYNTLVLCCVIVFVFVVFYMVFRILFCVVLDTGTPVSPGSPICLRVFRFVWTDISE